MYIDLATFLAVVATTATLSSASPISRRQAWSPSANDTWIWNDLGNNVCGNGSPTGFAYNMHADAQDLLIFLDGGGACWDTLTCFGPMPTATFVTGYNNATFQANGRPILENETILTSRLASKANPWDKSNMVFVPYCTGDVHGGNSVVTYPGASGPMYHQGYNNFQNILHVLTDRVPSPPNVWITGTSAGCFGATLNYVAAQKAWPSSRIHLIGDSCETTPGFLDTKPSWKLFQPSSPECPKCQNGQFNTFLPALSEANPGSRFASLSFSSDSVLPLFMGVDYTAFSAIITTYFASITSVQTNMAKSFTVAELGHGVLQKNNTISATGASISEWLATLKNYHSGNAFISV